MSNEQRDVSQAPSNPQYPFGATSDEGYDAAQVANSKLGGPGDIVERLTATQWQLPRASTDSEINRDGHGLPNG